jgi:poly-gamma-glutamate capsule biosynthesis protein CapA/YwtB (metallophosphatase superfamily)
VSESETGRAVDWGDVDAVPSESTSPHIYPFAHLLVHVFVTLTPILWLASLLTRSTSPCSVTLVFVGDVMLGRDVATALDGDWPAAFADVRPWLTGADLAFANLESPLTTAPFAGGRFDLRAPPEAVEALTVAGFDLVSLANNHALDGGRVGLAQTLATLDQVGTGALLGSEVDDLDVELGVFYTGLVNLRIAALAFYDTGQPLDNTAVAQAAAQADLVIVSMHWGAEYYPVTQRQRLLAQELVAAGADLVIGHGPHVLQPVEWIDGALVAYSLGNFLFDQPFPATHQGAILRISLDRGSIIAVEAIPTIIRRGRVQRATGDEATAILNQIRMPTRPQGAPTH